jgi:hypothetical protein
MAKAAHGPVEGTSRSKHATTSLAGPIVAVRGRGFRFKEGVTVEHPQ